MTPYRTEAAEQVLPPSPPEMPQWLARRRWFRRLLGGRWELWWCGAWPVDDHPAGYYAWFRVVEWNLPGELRCWPKYKRIDRFAVKQVGHWDGLGDVTIAREDWTR